MKILLIFMSLIIFYTSCKNGTTNPANTAPDNTEDSEIAPKYINLADRVGSYSGIRPFGDPLAVTVTLRADGSGEYRLGRNGYEGGVEINFLENKINMTSQETNFHFKGDKIILYSYRGDGNTKEESYDFTLYFINTNYAKIKGANIDNPDENAFILEKGSD